jgi:cysteine desulfurase
MWAFRIFGHAMILPALAGVMWAQDSVPGAASSAAHTTAAAAAVATVSLNATTFADGALVLVSLANPAPAPGDFVLLTPADGSSAAVPLKIARTSGGGALVVDAVQAAYHHELNASATGAAHLVVGSAKVGGPFGIAALISAVDAKVRPLIVGGGQERGRRGGTDGVDGSCSGPA